MWQKVATHYTCDSECDTECDTECDILHVTPSMTQDMWHNVTLNLTTNVTVYSWLLLHFHEIICGKNIFGNFLSNLLHFHEKTYYDCSFFTFAPLESPKFAWHHHQILDTYTIFKIHWAVLEFECSHQKIVKIQQFLLILYSHKSRFFALKFK